MKLYLIAPEVADNSDKLAEEARLRICNQRIADLISRHISHDVALIGVRQIGEASDPRVALDTRYGDAEVVRIADPQVLREVLLTCGDPNSGKWMLIRSLVTCRSVVFGYDGQAFVCLGEEDDPIGSPDDTLVIVEECSHMLLDTDLMDGLMVG